MELILFYILAALLVLSSLLVISFRNTLSSAISLVVALFVVASLYAFLGAHFLAAMQVLVYAGAVMVLFIFVIMMLNLGREELIRIRISFPGVVGILAGGYLTTVLVLRLGTLSYPMKDLPPEDYGTVRAVGRLLFTDYLVPFELTSILLLIAIVGAIVMTKKAPQEGEGQ